MIKDCNKKEKKCCGVSKVVIPAALGDENGEYRPQNGAYSNTLVEYQASGVSYLYSNDGIPTRMGDGIVATIEVGETTTLQPGESATVENTGDKYHAVLNFGIPEGQKGDTGDAATIEVGATTTGAPGSDASVTNSGDEHNAVLDFVIPRGLQGPQGVPGQAATIQVGTVTTLDPDQDATVVNSGTTSAAVFDFGIPKGDKGDTGSVSSEVVTELPVPGDDSKLYLMEKNPTVETADGAAFTIQNAANYGEMRLVEVDGNATQNGTPTPDAPVAVNTTTGENVVKITGKNLFSPQKAVTDSNNTETFITQDGEWLQFRTGAQRMFYNINLPSGQAITFKAIVRSLSSNLNVIGLNAVYADGTSAQFASITTTDTDEHTLTFTTTLQKELVAIRTGNTNGVATQFKINTLQLELGSTATPYEPYQGQDYEVNLGKNLFDKNSVTRIYAYFPSGTSWRYYNDSYSIRIPCQPNTKYTLTANNPSETIFRAGVTDSDTIPVSGTDVTVYSTTRYSNTNTPIYLTTGANAKYIVVQVAEGTASDTFDTMMLELGTATAYAPYFTPIELAKIGTYQDRIYKNDGKWYIEKQIDKCVLDGTRRWFKQSYGGNTYSLELPYLAEHGTIIEVISDHFTPVSWEGRVQNIPNSIYANLATAGSPLVEIRNTSFATDNDFKTWLASNNTLIYFILATPTTTEITNEALIEQLEAIAELYGGPNYVSFIGTGAQGEIAVEYQTWDKYNRYDVYIWNDQIGDYQILNS